MPVTFEGVSEYRRNFVVPQAISNHSPPPPLGGALGPPKTSTITSATTELGGSPPGPHPQQQQQQQGHVISAGLSSAKMAVIQEPAFARKRKPVDHGKKVTFTTDYADRGTPTKEGDLAMKFQAGFRRVGVPTPTEYKLQYTWKSPATPDHTPLLQAENLLNSQTGPSNYATNQQQPPHNGQHYDGGEGEEEEDFQDFEQPELHEDPLRQGYTVDGFDDSAQSPGQKANVNGKVPKLQLASDKNSPNGGKSKRAPHHCSSKAAKKKPKSHHHHNHHHHHGSHHHASKKHKVAHGGGRHSSKVFVSEYKRQFKAWSVPSSTSGVTKGKAESNKKEKNKIVAGNPQVLTDSSDPRLLKHKALPAHMPIARWGSEYSANFMSPSDFVYERGAWKGAPHPELFMKAKGSSPRPPAATDQPSQQQQQQRQRPLPPQPSAAVSWFDQLVELRQRADDYRTRAQRVHFPPYHLSTTHHHDNIDQDSSSSVTVSSMTSPPSSSEDQIPTEISSPISDSAGDEVHIHVPRDKRDQHFSQNQGRLDVGRLQDRVKKQYHSPQLFTKTAAPLGVKRDGDHVRMQVQDVEESWDSETISDDGESSLQDYGTKFRTSTPPPPQSQDGHLHVKAHGRGDAELSRFQEPGVEVGRLKSIPRPNAFSLGGGEGEIIEGRVPTPELRKSVPGQQSRHHLDTTTPSDGGLFISPSKPEMGGDRGVVKSVELPYPPVSPKYRRDMRSKVPIFPPPPRKVDSGHQKGDTPIVSSTTNEAPSHAQSISNNLGPRNILVPRPSTIPHSKPTHNLIHAPPSQPSHHHTTHKSQAHKTAPISVHVPQPKKTTVRPPQTSYSSPVRKLLFDSHSKQPSTSQLRAQHATKKFMLTSSQQYTKTSGVSSAKSSHSNVKSCETCGSYIRSSAVLGGGGGVGALGAGRSGRVAPPTNLSQIHSDRASALQQQSRFKVNEIRSKLASHSLDPRGAPTNLDGDYHQPPDSGLGSSDRRGGRREGGQRSSSGLDGRRGRGREVDELSLSSLSLSSCSVASDMLQKARERRDHFWTQPSHITAS